MPHYLKVDRSFHDQLVKACKIPFWYKLYVNIRNRMQVLFYKMEHMPEQAKLITAQHEAILDTMIDERFRKAKKKFKRAYFICSGCSQTYQALKIFKARRHSRQVIIIKEVIPKSQSETRFFKFMIKQRDI